MKPDLRKQVASATKWVLAVGVSAAVGSGVTLAMVPMIERGTMTSGNPDTAQTAADPSTVSTVTTKNVSTSSDITSVVKQTAPAVFAVVNYQSAPPNPWSTGSSQSNQEKGIGTGDLIAKDANYGYLVTNNHVVDGASKLEVVTQAGKHIQASLVGTDPYTDLAVIKIPVAQVKDVKSIPFSNSDNIQPGEPVVAIGTPLGLDFQDSVTSGIVSSKQRIMPLTDPNSGQVLDNEPFIQTDAAINPGNSGGPLLDMNGDIIGINSSKIADPSVQGMGFAIPSNEVKDIVNQLMKTGNVAHPALGIEGYSLATVPEFYRPDVPVNYGVYIQTVASNDAKAAGLQPKDVIVGINNDTIQTIADLRTTLFAMKPGDKVVLHVYRGQKKLDITTTLGTQQPTNQP